MKSEAVTKLYESLDVALADYLASRTIENRNRAVLALMPFVGMQAARIGAKNPYVTHEELVSAGVLGAIRAVERFRPERGAKLLTFAKLLVSGAIGDWLREMDPVSRTLRRNAAKLDADDPRVDCSLQYRAVTKPSVAVDKIDPPSRRDGHVNDLHRKSFPDRLLRGFSRTERLAVILYYYEGLTMREVAQTIGLSESRVSQLLSGLLPRMSTRVTPESLASV